MQSTIQFTLTLDVSTNDYILLSLSYIPFLFSFFPFLCKPKFTIIAFIQSFDTTIIGCFHWNSFNTFPACGGTKLMI